MTVQTDAAARAGRTTAGAPTPVKRWTSILTAIAVVTAGLAVSAIPAAAHDTSAYHQSDGAVASFPKWMRSLPDSQLLTELSLPGTHDTMTAGFSVSVRTQSMTLAEQLESGIRFLDIRLNYEKTKVLGTDCDEPTDSRGDCAFLLYHGFQYLSAEFTTDVMNVVKKFLADNPSEAVVMRVMEEDNDKNPLFGERLQEVLATNENILVKHSCAKQAVRLGPAPTATTPNGSCDARGKVTIIRQWFASSVYDLGLQSDIFPTPNKQDDYKLDTNWDLYDKWVKVRNHFNYVNAAESDPANRPNEFYANFLNGSVGSFPYFVASGHSSQADGAPRLATGAATPFFGDSKWPDFPRVTCVTIFIEFCTIAFEGINVLAMNNLNARHGQYPVASVGPTLTRVGLVVADFPGQGLIAAIININFDKNGNRLTFGGPNHPPVAGLTIPGGGSSYVGDEGTPITFDGGASTDDDGNELEYQWQLVNPAQPCIRNTADADAIRTYNEALELFVAAYLGTKDEAVVAFAESPEGIAAQEALTTSPDTPSQATYVCPDDDTFDVKLTVSDGVAQDEIWAPVTIRNVAPTVTANRATIDEDGVATVTGTITDPGVDDSFTLDIAWGEGDIETHAYPAGTTTFSEQHRYRDDNPTSTISDVYTISIVVSDKDLGTGTASTSVIVNNVAPVTSTDRATQEVQYSDPSSAVTFTASDVAGDSLVAQPRWGRLGSTPTAGLPPWLALSPDGNCTANQIQNQNRCQWSLTPIVNPANGIHSDAAPGEYVVTLRITDDDGGSSDVSTSITVLPEDARTFYVGPTFAASTSAGDGTAVVELRATIHDSALRALDPSFDPSPGDIGTATVRFVDRDDGDATLCTTILGYTFPGETGIATATCDWNANIGTAIAESHVIGIVVGGRYSRDHSEDDTVVTVAKPLDNFITGGGYLELSDSAGMFAGAADSKANFGFNVKFNRRRTNLHGNATLIIRSGGRTYQIKTNQLVSLGVLASRRGLGRAEFEAKANVTDVTDATNPIALGGNRTFQMRMTDNGTPGNTDTLGTSLWDSDGRLLFSSNWGGATTIEQLLGGGDLLVHGL